MELLLTEPENEAKIDTIDYDDNKSIKNGIWVYFVLLILEGSLRKWFLPGLATPLLVVRDPVALWLIYMSWKRGLFPSSIYLTGVVVLGIMSLFTAVFVGHGNIIVALYGARILLVHFPVIFIIGRVFNREDIIKMGKVTLYIAIPMSILITRQFYSPQSAWVNRGIAGDLAGAGFAGSGDYMRPPGTFSFTNGVSLFFAWLAPFVFYFWFNRQQINKFLLFGASAAMIMAIPFSISRGLFFYVCVTMIFAVLASLRKPKNLSKILAAMVVGLICLAVLSQTSYFNKATGAFMDRFNTAEDQEGGLVTGTLGNRFLGGIFAQLADISKQPFWGYGAGMGTNVGGALIGPTQGYIPSEGEWGRLVQELGPLMGVSVILLRIGLTVKIIVAGVRKLGAGDLLPWLLLSFGVINISMGQWAQPTSLGFCVMIGGLLLAALRTNPDVVPLQENI